jgi:hypothetical protein
MSTSQSKNKQSLSVAERAEVTKLIQASLRAEIEDKVTYTTQNGGIDFTGTCFSLTNALVRADGPIDAFTGALIKPTSLRVDFTYSTNQTFSNVRILVFQFRDASVPLTAAGVLEYFSTIETPHSPISWLNKRKINVLWDKNFAIAPVAGSYAVHHELIQINSRFAPIQFTDTGPVQPQMNGIYLLAVSDDSVAPYPQLTYISSLVYTDA